MSPHRDHGRADPFGMTLTEYAAARGVRPHTARTQYVHLLRYGAGGTVPPITRYAEDEGVIKFCLPVGDPCAPRGESESVIIPMRGYRGTRWYTLCVSSQVGCRMGCRFCETAHMGLVRNLTAGEIVRQYVVAGALIAERLTDRQPIRQQVHPGVDGIRNVVFMGMGEPLDNLAHVVQAIRVLNDPHGLNVALARITVSTAGDTAGIRSLAAVVRVRSWTNLRLAISLAATNDVLRRSLSPISGTNSLTELQGALLDYPLPRRGRYLIQYVLLKGINDAPSDAEQMARWCRPLPCIVNLIPYNPQRAARYEPPEEDTILQFAAHLRARGVFVKRRFALGRSLRGACGQLGHPSPGTAGAVNVTPSLLPAGG